MSVTLFEGKIAYSRRAAYHHIAGAEHGVVVSVETGRVYASTSFQYDWIHILKPFFMLFFQMAIVVEGGSAGLETNHAGLQVRAPSQPCPTS